MARCLSCSAPLPANTNLCSYCKVRNDVDLHGKHHFSISSKHSKRICPHCQIPLQTIKLKLQENFYIERCKSCFGLFFDPGEIETLLQSSVSNVFEINVKLLKNINKDRYQKKKQFSYIKCPVCRVLMNRVNFAHRSGVIIDRCKNHGIWLNNGEITHLMEWKKAGGQLLQEKNEQQLKQKKQKISAISSHDLPLYRHQPKTLETELWDTVSSLVFKLFK